MDDNIRLPQGFTGVGLHCGLKENGQKDLAVIYSKTPAEAAAVFTQNKVCGAPVIVGKKTLEQGILQGIVINSKISNVCTGQEGIDCVYQTMDKMAHIFNMKPSQVLVSSTGLIAYPLPFEKIKNGLEKSISQMDDKAQSIAEAIMTTDTHPKILSYKVGKASLVIIAKGSGMIEPNMATMLSYILTDAKIDSKNLQKMLVEVVDVSFNMLSIDTDTSTSDTVVMMANGFAGTVNEQLFRDTLRKGCIDMTKMLARDGEGATKLIQAEVLGGKTLSKVKALARSLIKSPLVKTMCYGADPNVGRILMALGKVGVEFEINKVEIKINNVLVFLKGELVNFGEKEIRSLLSQNIVTIKVNLKEGGYQAIAYGCDLTEGYIKENASYFSS